MKNQNKKGLTAVIALAVVLVTVAATYAFITFVIEGTKTNTITGGSLVVNIDESQNGEGDIVLDNAFPVSDAVGKQSTAYKFTVKNESTKEVNYTISLVDQEIEEDEVRLADSALKAYLTNSDDTEVIKDITLISDLGDRKLATGVLAANTDKDFALRIWIADTATDSDVWDKTTGVTKGKVFSAKIQVEAKQVAEYAVSVVNNATSAEIKNATVFYNGTAKIPVTLDAGTPTVTCQNKKGQSVVATINDGNLTIENVTDHITCSINYSE